MYSIQDENLVKEREQIKRILQEKEYGFIPQYTGEVVAKLLSEDEKFFAGHAVISKYSLECEVNGERVAFPVQYCRPKGKEKQKIVLLINFEPEVPARFLPAEEIIDRGWGFVSFCYKEVSSESAEWDNVARVLKGEGEYAPGKIAMWAWAAMRVMDWLYTLDEVDKDRVGVAGHSRLGKTALLTAAFDERFVFCHSNNSGSGGAALYAYRNEESEPIENLVKVFPYWFCPNFQKLVDKEKELDFDQHYLLSLIAPRLLSVSSAKDDLWANPIAEQKCAEKASIAWQAFGEKGLTPVEHCEIDKTYHDGKVGYYVREGGHFLSRKDWNFLLDFLDKHLG